MDQSEWLFLLRPYHHKPKGPFSRPTLVSPSLQLGLSLQLREQSSSLSWCMGLALGLCQVRVPDGRAQNDCGLPELALGY